MARSHSTGVDILLILAALALFILALTGGASKVFSSILSFLSGGSLIKKPIADTIKTPKSSTPKVGSNGGKLVGQKPKTRPATQPAKAAKQPTKAPQGAKQTAGSYTGMTAAQRQALTTEINSGGLYGQNSVLGKFFKGFGLAPGAEGE